LSPGRKGLGDAGRDPLTGLKKQLSEEYKGQPEDRIDQAARHGLDRLADARVRASLGFSRGDTPQSTFVELPEVFTSLPHGGQPWVTDTGVALAYEPISDRGRLPGVPGDQHGHLRNVRCVLR
jgi:hypothetical protein